MKQVAVHIPIGIGDILCFKAALDVIKDECSEIRIKFNRNLIAEVRRNSDYNQFLDQLGQLLFSEPPYIIDENCPANFASYVDIYRANELTYTKPALAHLMCKGEPLAEKDYIVLTTKCRDFSQLMFNRIAKPFFDAINSLNCKVVIMGERELEMTVEYRTIADSIACIYANIMQNIPSHRLIDLTVPKLGVTSPSLEKIQQDCLIMNQAKATITLGIGGNLCLAMASESNLIGFRNDTEVGAEMIFKNKEYPNAFVTKDIDQFLNKVRSLA